MQSHWTCGGLIMSYSHRLKRIWSFHFSGRGSCICKILVGLPRGEFGSSEDSQNILIHPMYSFDNVDALSLDVQGLDHVLQTSPQAHLIISHFYGRGSCKCWNWKGSPWGEFMLSEECQNFIIHLMYSSAKIDAVSLNVWGPDQVLQPSPQVYLIISHFYGRGSCICQTWKVSPRGDFRSSEDGQNIIIHPMYLSHHVDAVSLDVWGPDHVLQASPQAHLIISHFSGRGSCICQTWKGSPWGEFGSSEDGQSIIIHPMLLLDNVDALSLDIWGPEYVLQPSPHGHLSISHFSGRGSCICQTWKGLPRGEFGFSDDSQNITIHQMYSFDNVDAL